MHSDIGDERDKFSGMGLKDDWAASSPQLQNNLKILSSDQIQLAKTLLEIGQGHLFNDWPAPGIDDEEKLMFFEQVARLNTSYPGGLTSYVENARRLLLESKEGKNPFDGFTPSVPVGEVLNYGDDQFVSMEEVGIMEARNAAFVLVAGGLGERLGYNGIKLALPVESTTGTCFVEHYIESILALQEASNSLIPGQSPNEIPLVIMTSDDTHARTVQLLESNAYFGMKTTQVKLLKQEKVACLDDNDARLAIDPQNKYRIQTKPHGHGDVHSLLYSSGLLHAWHDVGKKWVIFFQDTNGLLFNAIPASLGVSFSKKYQVNSLAVPRKAKEAIGGISKLTHSDGRTMVINVEYNQLDPLLRATICPDGDVNCETGYSPFPGNINQLILELDSYVEELTKTKGAISEFVNPKYKDCTKTSFKSSTRLECMMQDYPKTLPPKTNVGFTVMDPWIAYAPVKNNPEDASKIPKGNPYHSATSGEIAVYRANCLILKKAGVEIANPTIQKFNGQEVEVWPRIVWKPKWGLTYKEIRSKISRSSSISSESTLVLNGKNVLIKDLDLNGALVVNSCDQAEIMIQGTIQNKGWILQPIDYKDMSIPEEVRIRGFRIQKNEELEKSFTMHGKFNIRT